MIEKKSVFEQELITLEWVALDAHSIPQVREELSKHPSPRIRKATMENPSSSIEILTRGATDPDPEVKKAATEALNKRKR